MLCIVFLVSPIFSFVMITSINFSIPTWWDSIRQILDYERYNEVCCVRYRDRLMAFYERNVHTRRFMVGRFRADSSVDAHGPSLSLT